VDSLIQKYKEDVLPTRSPRTQKDYVRYLNRLSVLFGKRAAETITPQELEEWVNQTPGGKGKRQREKHMWCLRAVLGHAVTLRWLQFNVVKELKLDHGKPPQKVVTEKELQRLKSLTKHQRLILAADLTLLTGLPQQEILDLTWSQVYPAEKLIRQHLRRTGELVEIHITPELEEVLRRCKELPIVAQWMRQTQSPHSRTSARAFRSPSR
jgi:integrase